MIQFNFKSCFQNMHAFIDSKQICINVVLSLMSDLCIFVTCEDVCLSFLKANYFQHVYKRSLTYIISFIQTDYSFMLILQDQF